MKTLAELFRENGNKGGFWVVNACNNKQILWVHGPSILKNSKDFIVEDELAGINRYMDYESLFELYTPPKPKQKVLAYISEGNVTSRSAGPVFFVIGGAEIERTGYVRAPWLDGEIE